MSKTNVGLWLKIARINPDKAYCPECSYPLRWTGGDFWSDQSPFVCDDCGFGKTAEPSQAAQLDLGGAA